MKNLLLLLFCVVFCTAQVSLPLGESLVGTVAKERANFYTIPEIPDLQDNSLIIVLSCYSGDADIYVSNSKIPVPSPKEHHWKSDNQAGVDLIEISKSHPQFSKGPYNIGIYGTQDAEYTLYAYISNSSIILKEATPQMIRIKEGQYAFFKYFLPKDGDFYISATALTGYNPIIYVDPNNEKPVDGNANWSFWFNDAVTIKRNDKGYKGSGWYYIGIRSFYGTVYLNLAVTHFTNASILSEGIYMHSDIEQGKYSYFKYKMVSNSDLKLALNVLVGRVDLFISTSTRRPDQFNYEWKLSSKSADELTIKTTDPKFKNNEWFYIGALGFEKSNQFHITAGTNSVHTILRPGRPSVHTIDEPGKHHWFAFFHDQEQNALDITAHTLLGEIQLYVSGGETNRFPNKGNYEKEGTRQPGSVKVEYNAPSHNTNYYIGVYAERAPCVFSIVVAATSQRTLLKTGQMVIFPARKNSRREFSYDIEDPSVDVTFSMNMLVGEMLDTYIAPYPPTDKNYTWHFRTWATGSKTIYKDDPNRANAGTQTLYLAVYGGEKSAYYGLTAFNSKSTVQLWSGDAIRGTVLKDHYQYFKYKMPNDGHFTVNVHVSKHSPHDDAIIVFVSRENEKPTALNFDYRSTRIADNYVISVDNAWQGFYYIGVFGVQQNTTYTIRISMDYEKLDPFGYTLYDRVRKGNYRYFSAAISEDYKMSNDQQGLIGLTLIKGVTEMYISYNETKYPTRTDYDAMSRTYPGHIISYIKTDPKFRFGKWNIGVYGVTDAEFMIRMNMHNDFQESLKIGLPVVGYVSPRPVKFVTFGFFLESVPHILTIKYLRRGLYPLGPFMSVYASQDYKTPTQTLYTWKAENRRDVIQLVLDGIQSQKSLYITVVASEWARVMVTLARAEAPIYITQDKAYDRLVFPNHTQSFQIPTSGFSKSLFISVGACDNKEAPAFYTSKRTKSPDKNSGFPSTSKNKFIQQYSLSETKHDDAYPAYYFALRPVKSSRYLSIYATTGNDLRPVPGDKGKLSFGSIVSTKQGKHFIITIPAASNDVPGLRRGILRYFVWSKEISLHESPANINLHTDCAIIKQATFVGEVNTDSSVDDKFTYEVVTPHKEDTRRYLFTVMVSNAYGHYGIYQPFDITIPGGGTSRSSNVLGILVIVFLCISVFLVVGYFGIGIAVKRWMYNMHGWDMIPNKDLWVWLFNSLKIALVYVFSCGKRREFSRLVDETDMKLNELHDASVEDGGEGTLTLKNYGSTS